MILDFLLKIGVPAGLLIWFGSALYTTWLEPVTKDVPVYVFHLAGWTWCIWFSWHLLQRFTR